MIVYIVYIVCAGVLVCVLYVGMLVCILSNVSVYVMCVGIYDMCSCVMCWCMQCMEVCGGACNVCRCKVHCQCM